jgi:hypothetical protein
VIILDHFTLWSFKHSYGKWPIYSSFTELKDGDFPLQILGVPEGNSGIATNIFP